MKKFNVKVFAGMAAAVLAAAAFAGCADAKDIQKKETAPLAAAANKTAAVQVADKKTETTAVTTKAKEEKAAATTTKKTTKKAAKKTAKKTTTKKAETAKPAATTKAAETTKKAQEPAVVIPETVVPADVYPVWVEGDVYAGTYAEEIAGRGAMDITRNSDGTYSVSVTWASSAFEKNTWNFSGEFDGRGVLRYTNCRKTAYAFNEDGSYACDSKGLMTPYTVYSAGSGYIEFKDEGVLEWHDDMGDILPGTVFVSRKANTKADEIGTAGSNYYANEDQAQGGWAGSNYFKNEGFFTGNFYDLNGSKVWLKIERSNMGEDMYLCTVTTPDTLGSYYSYGFLAQLEGDSLVYDSGSLNHEVYDENGDLKDVKIVSKDHTGSIVYSSRGLEWNDSDASCYLFGNTDMGF